MKTKAFLTALTVTALLAACGGSDFQVPPATTEVPASASQSVEGFIAYLQELVGSLAEMLEPVDTSSVTPPADDTREPQKVD